MNIQKISFGATFVNRANQLYMDLRTKTLKGTPSSIAAKINSDKKQIEEKCPNATISTTGSIFSPIWIISEGEKTKRYPVDTNNVHSTLIENLDDFEKSN